MQYGHYILSLEGAKERAASAKGSRMKRKRSSTVELGSFTLINFTTMKRRMQGQSATNNFLNSYCKVLQF